MVLASHTARGLSFKTGRRGRQVLFSLVRLRIGDVWIWVLLDDSHAIARLEKFQLPVDDVVHDNLRARLEGDIWYVRQL